MWTGPPEAASGSTPWNGNCSGDCSASGHTLLSAFVARQGDGDLGPQAETPDGRVVRRLPEPHDRRYVSIFGELTIARVVYGSREGQRIERVPLDERLGAARGRLLLRAGGLVAAALPQGVVRRGRSLAGDAPGAEAGDPDAGAHEPGGGGVRPGVPGRPAAAPAGGGGAAAGRHRRRQGGADAATAAGRTEAPSPPHQGREGEQEADGLRRGGLHHRAVRAEGRRHPRRGAAGRAGRGPARAAAQARLGRDDPAGRGRGRSTPRRPCSPDWSPRRRPAIRATTAR